MAITAGATTQLWELQRAGDAATWTEIRTVDVLPPITNAALGYDPVRRELVLVGTMGSSAVTYTLAYRSPVVPPESCLPGEDADGDELASCMDPDCAGRCDPLCPPYSTTVCEDDRPRCGDHVCSDLEDYVACPADCFPP